MINSSNCMPHIPVVRLATTEKITSVTPQNMLITRDKYYQNKIIRDKYHQNKNIIEWEQEQEYNRLN